MRRLDPGRETWMGTRETRAVMEALDAAGGAARFVGGAVRNALLGLSVDDVDIATILRPDEIVRRLEAAAIKALPTGIAHGTVTAILAGKSFEITTLRRDVTTDGRHAVVAFSDDWCEDARRRDFAINALYASADGEIFDYTNGVADLEARRIRFIGDPVARIREDYLRILRLFRFHAWYGRGAIDADALAAVHAERAGLRKLSAERVQHELLRILAAADPYPAVRAMIAANILAELVPGNVHLERFEHLMRIERAAHPILRLAALISSDVAITTAVADRLRLSNKDRNRLVGPAAPETFTFETSARELRVLLYRHGRQSIRDGILLRWAEEPDDRNIDSCNALVQIVDHWARPRFPLSGADILAAKIPEGPQVGKVLDELKAWWMATDFAPDRAALLERLNAIAIRGNCR